MERVHVILGAPRGCLSSQTRSATRLRPLELLIASVPGLYGTSSLPALITDHHSQRKMALAQDDQDTDVERAQQLTGRFIQPTISSFPEQATPMSRFTKEQILEVVRLADEALAAVRTQKRTGFWY